MNLGFEVVNGRPQRRAAVRKQAGSYPEFIDDAHVRSETAEDALFAPGGFEYLADVASLVFDTMDSDAVYRFDTEDYEIIHDGLRSGRTVAETADLLSALSEVNASRKIATDAIAFTEGYEAWGRRQQGLPTDNPYSDPAKARSYNDGYQTARQGQPNPHAGDAVNTERQLEDAHRSGAPLADDEDPSLIFGGSRKQAYSAQDWSEVLQTYFYLTGEHLSGTPQEQQARTVLDRTGNPVQAVGAVAPEYASMDVMMAHDKALQSMGSRKQAGNVSADELNRWVDFDSPFRVDSEGNVTRESGVYGPTVYHVEGEREPEIDGSGWDFVDGYSGQSGYSGPVMHASEQLAGGIARDVLEDPGVYVVTVVEDLDDMDNPAGWVLLKHKTAGRTARRKQATAPRFVVVDETDGYTYYKDGGGNLFTSYRDAEDFALSKAEGINESHAGYRVYELDEQFRTRAVRKHAYDYPATVGNPHDLPSRVNESGAKPFDNPQGYNAQPLRTDNPMRPDDHEMGRGEAMASLQHREARILEAMAYATSDERRVLAEQLNDLRRQASAARQADRDVDLAGAVIRDHLTPVLPHTLHTAGTDWLDESPTPGGTPDEAAREMAAQASLWFRKTHEAVIEDAEEFTEQAKGQARRVASAFGEHKDAAVDTFLREANRLRTVAGFQTTAQTKQATQDALYDYIEERRGNLKVEVIYTDGTGAFVSPDGEGGYWYDSVDEAKDQHGDVPVITVGGATASRKQGTHYPAHPGDWTDADWDMHEMEQAANDPDIPTCDSCGAKTHDLLPSIQTPGKNLCLGCAKREDQQMMGSRKTANTEVTVTGVQADQGTIVVMEGVTDEGTTVTFGVDHRMAQPIVDALERGEEPVASVPSWSMLGTASKTAAEDAWYAVDAMTDDAYGPFDSYDEAVAESMQMEVMENVITEVRRGREGRDGRFIDTTHTLSSRKHAGIYCKTHDVWVGDENASTHEDCSKEQRKTKDSRKRAAADREKCPTCGTEGRSGEDCPICGDVIGVESSKRKQGTGVGDEGDLSHDENADQVPATSDDPVLGDPDPQSGHGHSGQGEEGGEYRPNIDTEPFNPITWSQAARAVTRLPAAEQPKLLAAIDRKDHRTVVRLVRMAEGSGQTCSVCGDSIEKDPDSEDPQTYHHNNGEKHDHEAKPSGGDSNGNGDKESARRQAAFRQRVQANLKRR